jgi:hypothetical protein
VSHKDERLEKPNERIEEPTPPVSDAIRAPGVVSVDLTREAARQVFDRILESRARRAKAQS